MLVDTRVSRKLFYCSADQIMQKSEGDRVCI